MKKRPNCLFIQNKQGKNSSFILHFKKVKDKFAHFDLAGYNKNSYQKKYLECTLEQLNKDKSSGFKLNGKYYGQKNRIIFDFIAITRIYNHDLISHAFPA